MFSGVLRIGEAAGIIVGVKYTRLAAARLLSSLIFTYIYSGTIKLCREIGRLNSQPVRARDYKTAWPSAVIQNVSK